MQTVFPQTEIYQRMLEEPRAPMVLRIGIVGHRHVDMQSRASIRRCVASLYDHIHNMVIELAKSDVAKLIYCDTQPHYRLLSSVAEGADRLCIEPEMFPAQHELGLILPFLKEEYAIDFSPGNSIEDPVHGTLDAYESILARARYGSLDALIIEMDHNRSKPHEAYLKCGQLLVDHADILIAVFESSRSDSCSANVVEYARNAGVPIVQIDPSDIHSVKIMPSKRFGRSCEDKPFSQDLLRDELERILLFKDLNLSPQKAGNHDGTGTNNRQQNILGRLVEYTQETRIEFDHAAKKQSTGYFPFRFNAERTPWLINVFRSFKSFLTKSSKTTVNKSPSTDYYPLSTAAQRLDASYQRADMLANLYGDLHRSTFLLIYFLGALALITAAFALKYSSHHGTVLGLVILELATLATIYGIYRRDHHGHFHRRWLEYRWLAETLRPMPFLNLLGRALSPYHIRDTGEFLEREAVGHGAIGSNWLYVYTESINRAAGFSHCRLHQPYRNAVKQHVLSAWIEGQIAYHKRNSVAMETMGKKLASWSNTLFFATVAAVVLKFLILVAEFSLHNLLTLIAADELIEIISTIAALSTAILPTLASMFFAIRNHGEFDISAQRSRTMSAFMITKFKQLHAMKDNTRTEKIVRAIQQVAMESLEETSDWLEIYEVKETEPA